MTRNRVAELARLVSDPVFGEVRPFGQSLRDYSLQTVLRARRLTSADVNRIGLWLGRGEPAEFPDFLSATGWIGAYDVSLGNVLISHQIAGDVVLSHGSPRQVEEFGTEIDSMSKVYCFSSSELHAGSDLKRLGTTATYRPQDHSLVLHTPSPGNTKVWTGNSLHSGDVAMVLCLLQVNGRNEGHHWLRVPLRTGGRITDGVRIWGMEPKGGVEANQTGMIAFDHCVLPASALMARWASIDEHGVYTSDLPRPQRFTECLSTFTHERMIPIAGAAQAQRLACAITTRFASVKEVVHSPLLEREHYRLRLSASVVRALAGMHAVEAMAELGAARSAGGSPAEDRLLHTLVSVYKSGTTEDARRTLAETRELCGGLGYHRANQISPLQHDHEVIVTMGGDNTMISYQAALVTMRDRAGLDGLLDEAVVAAEKAASRLGPDEHLSCGRLVQWMSQISRTLFEQVCDQGNGARTVAWSRAVYQTLALGHWARDLDGQSLVSARLFQHYATTCLLEHALDALRHSVLTQADLLLLDTRRERTGTAPATTQELLDLLAVPEELITAPIAYPDFAERHLATALPAPGHAVAGTCPRSGDSVLCEADR